jgi:hypothetical protein
LGEPGRDSDLPVANWAAKVAPEVPLAPAPAAWPVPEAVLVAPALLLPELPVPELPGPVLLSPELAAPPAAPLPSDEPVALPVLPKALVRLEEEDPRGAAEVEDAPAAPEDPPGPLKPVAARPDAWVDPEAAEPVATAAPDAPEALPPVEPDDWLEVWVAGPEAPDAPPGPLPAVLDD